jgi:hypothetical protein
LGTSKSSAPISAAKRTVDLFTGKTPLEEQEERDRIAAEADIQAAPKERTPLSPKVEAERWSAKGTVRLNGLIQGFRVSEVPDGGYLLERLGMRPGADQPYFYGVFSFPRELLEQLYAAIGERLGK